MKDKDKYKGKKNKDKDNDKEKYKDKEIEIKSRWQVCQGVVWRGLAKCLEELKESAPRSLTALQSWRAG